MEAIVQLALMDVCHWTYTIAGGLQDRAGIASAALIFIFAAPTAQSRRLYRDLHGAALLLRGG